MDVLLDTHTFIWFIEGDSQLPKKAREIIKDISNKCFVSIASIWEIAIKISLDKLELNGNLDDLAQIISDFEFELLPISIDHIIGITSLPFHHRDPFDRLIIAQARAEKTPIITSDSQIKNYPIQTIWN